MSQGVPGTLSSDCYVGSHTTPYSGRQIPRSNDTSNTTDPNLSSAAQIGQRLAAIGDEFHRHYDTRMENKMAHVIRESIRIAGHCQSLVLSLFRSVRNVTSRADHSVTQRTTRTALVHRMWPGTIFCNMLLLAALAAVCGLLIKLGLDD